MSGTADAVVVLAETFQAYLEEGRHLDRYQLRDLLPGRGIAEDCRGKAPFHGRTVYFGERGVEEGVAARKRDRPGDVSFHAERAQVVEDAHRLIELQFGTAAPVITVLAVKVAILGDMPLKREGGRTQVLFECAVAAAVE